MPDTPLTKRQRVNDNESREFEAVNGSTKSPLTSNSNSTISHTPKKLVIGTNDDTTSQSQPIVSSSSLQAPSLQHPNSSSRGREQRTYSQSPPRSPGRSPTRKLELIKISPVKKSRLELQRLYDAEQSQRNAARLCINKLVLQDFKSYAGRQVVGPFHSSFSAVVGPNGSGKSNVIDSMLFVFGFRANKMRQDRLSDLIHNSEVHPNLKSCSVEVHFQYVVDEPDGTTRIDEEKPTLVVTRKAFKNNSSKYYVNDKESNYTEVTQLLKKEGIDLDHKRFLILQGEVENIAQMRPKAEKEGEDGLLEYLEDITGTAKYKPQIETILQEIEVLNESCIEKENRFHIVDQEKSSLETGKDEALEFLEKEKTLTLLRSKMIQYKIWQNDIKLTSTLDKSSKLKGQLDQENEKYSETLKEVDSLKDESKQVAKRIETLAIEEKALLAQKRGLDQQRVAIEEKIKSVNQKTNKAEKLLKSNQHSLNATEANLRELRQSQLDYEKELQDLNQELITERAKLEDVKISLKEKTVNISAGIAQYEKDLEPWDEQLQQKRAEIQLAESELSLLKDTNARINKDIEQLKNEIARGGEEKLAKEKVIRELKQEESDVTAEVHTAGAECSSASARLKKMHEILIAQRQRTLDARAAFSSAQNKSTVLTALTKLQKSGRISGFHGRLGDLGVIDEKYDVAISTACPRLEDIVVESVECGQQCIEYLRKNKLGYARFILLDKLRKFHTGKIQTPENVPRLFDLVKPKDDKFIPAFYSVLRDTLAAQSLAQANRVAYGKKRFRVVSLDGKLIDISGTMSGGGSHVVRGLMRLSQNNSYSPDIFSPEEVAQLENELTEREKSFQIASDTFREMEDQLKKLKDRVPEIQLKVSKLVMETESWINELKLKEKLLLERLEAQKKATGKNEEYQLAEARVKTLKDEQRALSDQTTTTRQKIAVLKDKIMEIGGSELQIQNSKVTSTIQRMEILTSKQKKGKASIKKAENELKKSAKIVGNTQKDLDLYSQEIASLKENADNVQQTLESVEKSVDEQQDLSHEMNEKLDQLKQRLAQMEAGFTEFKSLKIEINDKLEKLNALLGHITKEVRQLESDLNNLKIRDVTRTLQLLDEGESTINSKMPNELQEKRTEGADATRQEGEESDVSMEEEKSNDEVMEADEKPHELENGLPRVSEAELKSLDVEDLGAQIEDLQNYVDSVNVDVEILEEYAKRLAEHKRRKVDLNEAVGERDAMREKLGELKKRRFDEFMQGFGIISMTLKEMYQMITMGGNAELELVDSLDPFSEGVTFSVMPPKKSWRNITNLSGGEKTLSSLALVFALHKYKPTPLYVMDEIDAALDFRNVSIVANYIKERTKNAQFIVISLRNNMFELAQQLVGIYKTQNMTKSASLKNNDILNRT